VWITANSNICSAMVVDTTNTRAWGITQQYSNGASGLIGLGGSEISTQTYVASTTSTASTATFTLQATCQSAATATGQSTALTLSPSPTTFLDVTPVLSN
jgi:hypothetical protein